MSRRSGIVVAVVIVVPLLLLAAAYFGSPYWAVHQLQDAAKAGDTERFSRYVDYPAVRQGIMSQLQAMMLKPNESNEKKGNAFAAMLKGGMATMLFDAVVSQEGIANIISTGRPKVSKKSAAASAEKPSAEAEPPPRISRSYEGLDVFKVEMRDPKTDAPLPTLVLHRSGWFGWKLRSLQLDALTAGK